MSTHAAVFRLDLDEDGAQLHPWVAKARAIDRRSGAAI